jgi:methyltransferase (TIGR00027 family)
MAPAEPTRPSRTARTVAAARAVGANGAHDPLARAALPGRDAAAAGVLRSLVARSRAADLAARVVTGGLTTHAILRMRAVDEAVVAAVDAGCRQVVVVGAGFDTRAWRLEALARTVVYEVDRAAIQLAKRRRLAGRSALTDVRFVAADLAQQDLDAELGAAGHDPSLPTAWVSEAVFVYLTREVIEDTLAAMAARSASGSHLALTFVVPELVALAGLGRLASPAVRAIFSGIGEPLRSLLTEDDVERMLEAAGFEVRRITEARAWSAGSTVSPRPDLFAAERLATSVTRRAG